MKWRTPTNKTDRYRISECGAWCICRDGNGKYLLSRLGKEKRTARGEQFWEGSEPVHYGTREECEAIADSV